MNKNRTYGLLGALVLGSAALQIALTAKPLAKPLGKPIAKPSTAKKTLQKMAAPSAAKATAKAITKTMPFYDFKLQSLDGKPVDMAKYKGKTILVVNTASKCGYTKQYAGLQQLHEKYAKAGLAVLGFPANNFGGQEPGTDSEIVEFCQKNYGVKFDMFSKTSVKGDDKAPLFRYLTTDANPELKGEIDWNFEKFLISRDGKLISRFKSGVTPDSTELTKAVETELAKK